MSSTSALPPQRRAALRRNITADSTISSTTASPDASPFDSPRTSPSSTSLSSMGEEEELEAGKAQTQTQSTTEPETPAQQKLFDSYGDEFQIPDYTIKELRDAIPAHCFERSAATGLYYVARDLFLLGATFYLANRFVTPEYVPSRAARAALWALYTFMQGLVATGVWVLAHECGHQSFSPSKTLNDTVGWVLHSALLVPYFSWKISHGKHHKATGHIERDMVFVPLKRDEYATRAGRLAHQLGELAEETPIATLAFLIYQQIGGWPAYLLTNVTGHNHHERQSEGKGKGKVNGFGNGVNHFDPASPLYEKKDEHLIILSDIGIGLVATVLATLSYKFGLVNMLVWYFIPYLWVNHWLVAVTFLQHTDPSLPHYEASEWTFARGAAATIDRDFWPIGPHLFHGIIETHVLHHYISTIPFYHADEATEAIKGVMGRHYRADTRGGALGFLRSMYTSARRCQWVEEPRDAPGSGVLFFRNRNGLGPYKAGGGAAAKASS